MSWSHIWAAAVAASGLSLAAAASSAAEPGDLDTGFGRFGVAVFDRPLDFTSAAGGYAPRAIELTDLRGGPGGTLVAVGQLHNSPDSDDVAGSSSVVAIRYFANGAVDRSFGDAGAFVGETSVSYWPAGAVDAAGRTYIAALDGTDEDARTVVMRLTAGGTLDASYGGGTGEVDLGQSMWRPAVALQANGKLLVTGVPEDDNGAHMLTVWRIQPDGSLDTSFGSGGVAMLGAFADTAARLSAVSVQPDGRIVVAGSAPGARGRTEFLVARLRRNGSLDPSFGAGGIRQDRIRLPGRDGVAVTNAATSLELQDDGKPVVAGTLFPALSRDAPPDDPMPWAAVARYTRDGHVDKSFSGNGHVTTRVDEARVPMGGLLLHRGRILLVVRESDGTRVVAYRPSGRRDPSFGDGGSARVPLRAPEAIHAVSDGRFLVGARNTEACGFGMPVASFDGRKEPDVRVVGRATLDGLGLRLRLRGLSPRQIVRGRATAIAERSSTTPEPGRYGRPCSIWNKLADARFRLRGENTAVIRLRREDVAFVRRARRVIVRVASRTDGRGGRTVRRVRVRGP